MTEALRLPDGWDLGPNIQRVLGGVPRHAGHVRGTPRKDIGVCAEKVGEHCFLSGVELKPIRICLEVSPLGSGGTALTVSASSKFPA
jgi:hypothetical protein